MFRQLSLKTIKKLKAQDASSGKATEPLKADPTVEDQKCSAAGEVTRRVLQKMKRKDLEQRLPVSTAAAAAAPNPQAITEWEHGVKERRKTVSSVREYARELTIDTNTLHKNLSDADRKVTAVREERLLPDHPHRFDVYLQLLCGAGLTGFCYWDFEWTGWVEVSVSYAGIGRKGSSDHCRFGFNAQSWVLECSDSGPSRGYSVRHDSGRTALARGSVSGRAAVFVDCPAGTVSFYEVSSDELTPLHTFSTTFSGPLYPGFGLLSPGSSVSLKSSGGA
ncbi:stonustoxin subunit alpha-like isoform X2 [Betta splendens]|uniref:Stonustoxin subunit alpha-like isoform X2 n=1 Tax=Betta splendens TaxID=158456 RepID=A0A6P7MY24_BETSP|nr:stonustoxin subunit alpha-like isoform X2 [Betta splendens]